MARNQLTSDAEIQSFTVLTVICTTVGDWGGWITSLMVSLQFTEHIHERLKLWLSKSLIKRGQNPEHRDPTVQSWREVTRPYANEHKMAWCPGTNSFNGSRVLHRHNELWPWLTQNCSTEEWLVVSGCTRCHTQAKQWPKWWHCFRNNLIRFYHKKWYCCTARNIPSPMTLLRIGHEEGEG
jgi:hypothetical protein